MSIKSLLNDLSTTLRSDNANAFYPILKDSNIEGLDPASAGMTLENMINTIKTFSSDMMPALNTLLKSRWVSEVNTNYDFKTNESYGIPQGFFAFNGLLQSLSCPNVINIPSYFCFNCTNLTTASFEKAVSIGNGAFTYSGVTNLSFPLVTRIGGSSSNTYDTLLSSVPGAFAECTKLQSIDLPLFTTKGLLDNGLFYNCKSLVTVNIPNYTGVNILNDVMSQKDFYGCSALSKINIPKMQVVGEQCFYNCTNLITVKMEEVTEIQSNAFTRCSNLKTIVLNNEVPPSIQDNTFNNTPFSSGSSNAFIYVPDDFISVYEEDTNWCAYAGQYKPISEYVEV